MLVYLYIITVTNYNIIIIPEFAFAIIKYAIKENKKHYNDNYNLPL